MLAYLLGRTFRATGLPSPVWEGQGLTERRGGEGEVSWTPLQTEARGDGDGGRHVSGSQMRERRFHTDKNYTFSQTSFLDGIYIILPTVF